MGIYRQGRPKHYCPSTGEGRKPPAIPGEYRIRDESGRILYIGETNDLGRRMKEHIRSGKLGASDSFEYKEADGRSTSRTRREHEREKIKRHMPALNKSKGGEGRPVSKGKGSLP